MNAHPVDRARQHSIWHSIWACCQPPIRFRAYGGSAEFRFAETLRIVLRESRRLQRTRSLRYLADVGGHLAVKSATRTRAEDLQRPRWRTGSPETAIAE